jgi:hypothetical protein
MKTKSGRVLKREEVDVLAARVEQGLDLSRWVPRRGRPSLSEAGFGPSPRVGARVSGETYEGLLKRAEAEGRTPSEVVRSLVEAYVSEVRR